MCGCDVTGGKRLQQTRLLLQRGVAGVAGVVRTQLADKPFRTIFTPGVPWWLLQLLFLLFISSFDSHGYHIPPPPTPPPSQSPIRIVKKKKKSMPRPSSGFNLHRCQIDGSGWIGAGPVEPPGDVRSAMDPGGIWWTRVNWPAANSMTQWSGPGSLGAAAAAAGWRCGRGWRLSHIHGCQVINDETVTSLQPPPGNVAATDADWRRPWDPCLPVDIWPDPTDPCGRNPVLLILPLINTVVSIEFDASDGADSAPAASDLDPPGSSWILRCFFLKIGLVNRRHESADDSAPTESFPSSITWRQRGWSRMNSFRPDGHTDTRPIFLFVSFQIFPISLAFFNMGGRWSPSPPPSHQDRPSSPGLLVIVWQLIGCC